MNILLEIGMEEIPARFLQPALKSIEEKINKFLKENRIKCEEVKTFGTPRRLVLLVNNLEEKQEDLNIVSTGPAKRVAFGENGELSKAGMGFIKSQNATIEDVEIVSTPKGEYISIKKFIPGKEVAELLPEALENLIKGLTFPKSMKWSDKKMKFARPLQWILALKDDQVIEFEVEGYKASNETRGHRFFGASSISVENIEDYFTKVRENNVIIDTEERKEMIRKGIKETCIGKDEEIIIDEELLKEVSNLVEYPYPMVGSFNSEFLSVPQEVLIISMQVHQRYFPILDKSGKILPKFVVVRNGIEGSEHVRSGNEKVLSARLSDARFFYQEDLKKPLGDSIEKLKRVVFQKDLGTIYEKVERSKRIATALIEKYDLKGSETDIIRTIELAKADLVSNMIGEKEFTKLQGFIGAEYALKSGESEKVSKGIEEHYYPRYQGDKLPEGIEGIITGICDRIDTLVGCFGIGLIPTSSKDPFALRRAAQAIVNIIIHSKLPISIEVLVDLALDQLEKDGVLKKDREEVRKEVLEFIEQRILYIFTNLGYKREHVLSILEIDRDDLMRLQEKLDSLLKISKDERFKDLIALLNRVGSIVSKLDKEVEIQESLFATIEEENLYTYYIEFKEKAGKALENLDYKTYFNSILDGKNIIDNYFENTMVMAENEVVRDNRLAQLSRLNTEFRKVANLTTL